MELSLDTGENILLSHIVKYQGVANGTQITLTNGKSMIIEGLGSEDLKARISRAYTGAISKDIAYHMFEDLAASVKENILEQNKLLGLLKEGANQTSIATVTLEGQCKRLYDRISNIAEETERLKGCVNDLRDVINA